MTIEAQFRLQRGGFKLDVDLTFPARGVTALFGPSGCGKTTLLRAIAGLERESQGSCRVKGEVWQSSTHFLPTHQRPIGFVFQEATLFPHLTVRGNLEYGLKRTPPGRRRVQLEEAAALLGVDNFLHRKPQKLSGGERQRVAIARALLTSPRLLLMDEPLAALDQASKREILPYLERLHDELEMPVLYVSHAAEEVARLADYLVVMAEGKVLATGPLTETLARLDLPIHQGENTGVVVKGIIRERNPRWHLARAAFQGGDFWIPDTGFALGKEIRLRILARDVSLSLEKHTGTSILNIIPATVVEIAEARHPGVRRVKLMMDQTPLVARLTVRSTETLQLKPGKQLWAQIKSVAVLE
ncbi:MAG: molybdenum ABC transporter ATP-binding protein [Magnetococcales bacterium]|nr:molybdenum ABC transporter ATP-binding protein [Magnetococcales bacterium]